MALSQQRDDLGAPLRGGRSRESREERSDWTSLLTSIAVILGLVLIAIPALNAAIIDPAVRWLLLLLLFLICGIILVVKVYPARKPEETFLRDVAEMQRKIDDSEQEIFGMDRALAGESWCQRAAYLHLRNIMVQRLMLNHHLTRSEAEDLITDAIWLREVVRDRDLIWLLTTDFEAAYHPLALSTPAAKEMIASFGAVFPRILSKMESMR